MERSAKAAVATVLLWLIGADLAVLLLGRTGIIHLPARAPFLLILPLLLLSSLFWWLFVDERLRRHAPQWARAALAIYVVVMLLPFAMALPGVRPVWDRQPVPVIMWVMIWHFVALLVACAMLGRSVIRLPIMIYRALAGWSGSSADAVASAGQEAASRAQTGGVGVEDIGGSETTRPVRIDRREMLGWVTAVGSLAAVGVGVRTGYAQCGRFLVRRVRLALPRCPDRLKGLTITHVSDLHVGRLLRPEHLPAMVEAANRLNSDLVVVTGDIVDHSIDFLPAAADAIAQLEHRHGRFLVMGNHDLIDSGARFVAKMRQRERGFLCDEHTTIVVGGEKIQIAGLRWSHADHSDGNVIGHDERASIAMLGADPRAFTIALAHHPHAFDALAPLGVDLTLSGHTHGGQFCLPMPGTGKALSAAGLLFRYIHGEYRQGTAALFVNAGVGNWFPVRINAPAEIVQIQLV